MEYSWFQSMNKLENESHFNLYLELMAEQSLDVRVLHVLQCCQVNQRWR